jgi:hypothetical protein
VTDDELDALVRAVRLKIGTEMPGLTTGQCTVVSASGDTAAQGVPVMVSMDGDAALGLPPKEIQSLVGVPVPGTRGVVLFTPPRGAFLIGTNEPETSNGIEGGYMHGGTTGVISGNRTTGQLIANYNTTVATSAFSDWFTFDLTGGTATCVQSCLIWINGHATVGNHVAGLPGASTTLATLDLFDSPSDVFDLVDVIDTSGLTGDGPQPWPMDVGTEFQCVQGDIITLKSRYYDSFSGSPSWSVNNGRLDIVVIAPIAVGA